MLNELAKEIHANNIEKGFYEKPKNIGEMLCLIHSEVSEALEADRKDKHAVKTWNMEHSIPALNLQNPENHQYFKQEFSVAIKDTFEDELADVMIRVLDLCAYKNINIEYHIKMKMLYNSMREKYHGKKY